MKPWNNLFSSFVKLSFNTSLSFASGFLHKFFYYFYTCLSAWEGQCLLWIIYRKMITKERIWEQQRLNWTDKNLFKFHCMRSFHSWKCHHFPRDSICMHDIFLTIQRLASQKRICLTEEKKRAAKNNHPDIHVLFVLYFVVLKKNCMSCYNRCSFTLLYRQKCVFIVLHIRIFV